MSHQSSAALKISCVRHVECRSSGAWLFARSIDGLLRSFLRRFENVAFFMRHLEFFKQGRPTELRWRGQCLLRQPHRLILEKDVNLQRAVRRGVKKELVLVARGVSVRGRTAIRVSVSPSCRLIFEQQFVRVGVAGINDVWILDVEVVAGGFDLLDGHAPAAYLSPQRGCYRNIGAGWASNAMLPTILAI
jgi:hypothetical protein